MRARILIGAAVTGSMVLVLVVMCVGMAQNPPTRSRSSAPEAANQIPSFADETPYRPRAVGGTNVPLFPAPSSSITSPGEETQTVLSTMPTSPQPARPAVIELKNGLKLAGKLAADPINFQVMFGQASLPLETIRGIRIADQVPSDGGPPQLISATIILGNGDSLTGMPRLDVIRLQTEWGEAIVKLTHLKSVVVMGDDVAWQEHEGRWRLVPATQSQAESREDSTALPPIDPAGILPPAPPTATVPAAPMPAVTDSQR